MHLNVNFKDTLICFACENSGNEKSPKTIACQAYVEYEFKREKIKKIKKQIYSKIESFSSLEDNQNQIIQFPINWMRV